MKSRDNYFIILLVLGLLINVVDMGHIHNYIIKISQ